MNLMDLSAIPIQSLERYNGTLPYAKYFKNESLLRSISLDSLECGKMFCIYQSEAEEQKFYENFEYINLSFYDIESYIQSRTATYEISAAEKMLLFNKTSKKPVEHYASFVSRLKSMVHNVLPPPAIDSCLLTKLVAEVLVKYYHVQGHQILAHNIADLLAKGEPIDK